MTIFNSLSQQTKTLIEPYWQRMNTRERTLVSILGGLAAVALVYAIAWLPVANGITERKQQLQAQQQVLAKVREQAGLLQAAREGGGAAATSNQASGSLTQRVTRLADQNNISVTRMQPGQGGLLVVIDEAPFTNLVEMLNALQGQGGMVIESLDVAEGSAPGLVRVRKLQVRG
ncbi:MAG TPA: type II secretion system protein M [Pseudidiomarina sp.]|nr:type II secretion system protein M [Pseudidiomarina sp.]